MTACKVVDVKRHEARQRRGGARVKGESALGRPDSTCHAATMAQVAGNAPTPVFAAMMVEQCQRLFERLADPDLESLAAAKLEGYTNEELSGRLGCSVRTVERPLHLIRKKWQQGELP